MPKMHLANLAPLHPLWLEVAAFFGSDFRIDWCNAKDDKVLHEYQRYPDAATFYRQTDMYCYHSVGFWLEGWKRPYLAQLLMASMGGGLSVLDYGCGPGLDGLWLLQAGYRVTFADFPSRSLEFCRWRLQRHHYGPRLASVVELADDAQIPWHHLVWCIDVLEHVPSAEQEAFLRHLYTLGGLVLCNLVTDADADGTVHHPVDVEYLTQVARSYGPCIVQDYHTADGGNTSRLLLFGSNVSMTPDEVVMINAEQEPPS